LCLAQESKIFIAQGTIVSGINLVHTSDENLAFDQQIADNKDQESWFDATQQTTLQQNKTNKAFSKKIKPLADKLASKNEVKAQDPVPYLYLPFNKTNTVFLDRQQIPIILPTSFKLKKNNTLASQQNCVHFDFGLRQTATQTKIHSFQLIFESQFHHFPLHSRPPPAFGESFV